MKDSDVKDIKLLLQCILMFLQEAELHKYGSMDDDEYVESVSRTLAKTIETVKQTLED